MVMNPKCKNPELGASIITFTCAIIILVILLVKLPLLFFIVIVVGSIWIRIKWKDLGLYFLGVLDRIDEYRENIRNGNKPTGD